MTTNVELEVKQGSAVAFSNVIPHRFRKIVNQGEEPQQRTFLNFFVVDPSRPLRSSKVVPTKDLITRCLATAKVPAPIVSHILSCIQYVYTYVVYKCRCA
jgi:hypothetical protein